MPVSRRKMLIQSAAAALTLAGCKHFDGNTGNSGGSGRFRVGLIYFAPEEGADLCMKGVFDGL